MLPIISSPTELLNIMDRLAPPPDLLTTLILWFVKTFIEIGVVIFWFFLVVWLCHALKLGHDYK